jgi:DNA polymerase-3 subunit alpha
MLVRAGAFDCLNTNRKSILVAIDKLVSYSASVFNDRLSSQSNLFGDINDSIPAPLLDDIEDWMPIERLREENIAIGFYISGHPLDNYLSILASEGVVSFAEIKNTNFSKPALVSISGIVTSKQERQSSRGNRYAFVQFSDPTDIFEITVFADVLEKYREVLEVGTFLLLVCEVKSESDQVRLRLKIAKTVDSFVANTGHKGFMIYINKENAVTSLAKRLDSHNEIEGIEKVAVNLVVINKDLPGDVQISLPNPYSISMEMIGAIKHIDGVVHIEKI